MLGHFIALGWCGCVECSLGRGQLECGGFNEFTITGLVVVVVFLVRKLNGRGGGRRKLDRSSDMMMLLHVSAVRSQE